MNSKGVVDLETIQAYNDAAHEIADKHESKDRTRAITRIKELFTKGSLLLEIGSGTGINAEAMHEEGFNIISSDASSKMLEVALLRRPVLRGITCQLNLPNELPFGDDVFDGVIAISVLQHLHIDSIPEALEQMKRVVRHQGLLLIRVFDDRSDIDKSNRDSHGRLMTMLPPDIFVPMSEAADLKLISTQKLQSKRDFVQPREYVLMKL